MSMFKNDDNQPINLENENKLDLMETNEKLEELKVEINAEKKKIKVGAVVGSILTISFASLAVCGFVKGNSLIGATSTLMATVNGIISATNLICLKNLSSASKRVDFNLKLINKEIRNKKEISDADIFPDMFNQEEKSM